MRKLLCFLLALLCLGAMPAQAEETWTIRPLQTLESRVKLRKEPSTDASILGQYFAGTPMTVLSISNGWAHVSIAGQQGYMMSEFLTRSSASETGADLPQGYLIEKDGEKRINIFESPSRWASVTACNIPKWIQVMGTCGDEWLHVRAYLVAPGADEVYSVAGFVLAWQVGQSEWSSAAINSGSAEGTVNFRQAPSRGSQVIGRLFSGAPVHILFDDTTADDGWKKVRVGTQTGFIMDDYLDTAYPSLYRAPMTEIRGTSIQTYARTDRQGALSPLGRYDPFYVLGVFEDMYYVRIETWLTETVYGSRYAFVPIQDMQRRVTRSSSAEAVIVKDTQIYHKDSQGNPHVSADCADAWFRPGMKVIIYGGVLDLHLNPDTPSEYIWPGSEYLLVTGIAENGYGLSGYIPIDAVDFDEALVLPEAFTLG